MNEMLTLKPGSSFLKRKGQYCSLSVPAIFEGIIVSFLGSILLFFFYRYMPMQFFGIAPEQGASQKEMSSSKHFFSEAMLIFWVYLYNISGAHEHVVISKF